MNRFFFLIFSICLLAACVQEKKPRPDHILPESKMVDVLVSIHISEAMSDNTKWNRDEIKALYQRYEDRLLEEHGVDQEKFTESYSYYLGNLNELKVIYDGVVDSLGALKSQLAPPTRVSGRDVRP